MFEYCYVSQPSKIEYKLVLNTEFGERFEFFKTGKRFDAFGKSLSDALNKMMLRSQTTIKEIVRRNQLPQNIQAGGIDERWTRS